MTKLSVMTAATDCAASISYDTALAILAAHATPLDAISLPLTGAAGCYLAEAVHARLNSPRFDCAAMDGYAVRAADVVEGSSTLTQIGISYADSGDAGEIGAGEIVRVMTGAPLPRGADRVVMIEYCRAVDTGVTIEAPPSAKPHIRRRGSDFALGQLLLPTGTKITSATAIVAAAGDHGELSVTRRPRIQLLATGDEILAPGAAAEAGFSIPDSLTAAIDLMCVSAGADVVSKARLRDNPEAIASARQAPAADIIVVLGGASRGDRDFGRSAFAPLGLEIAFADVDMKPGKPVWYGMAGAAHIIGIPGNPAAALAIARLFLVPLITRLMGGDVADALPWQLLPAVAPIEGNGAREAFLYGTTSYHGVAIGDRQDASGQARLAHGNALVRRRAHAAPILPGMLVPTLPLCC